MKKFGKCQYAVTDSYSIWIRKILGNLIRKEVCSSRFARQEISSEQIVISLICLTSYQHVLWEQTRQYAVRTGCLLLILFLIIFKQHTNELHCAIFIHHCACPCQPPPPLVPFLPARNSLLLLSRGKQVGRQIDMVIQMYYLVNVSISNVLTM